MSVAAVEAARESITAEQWRPKRLRPEDVVPKHVRHCYECGARDWWIYTWRKGTVGKASRSPYRCNSWRCPGCRRHEASVTFARIMEAFTAVEARAEDCVFVVLTLDREGYYSGERWRSAADAYRALSAMSRAILKRWRRWLERTGRASFGSRWVATVEAHRTGWPHVNLVIHSPDLAAHLRAQKRGTTGRDAVLLEGELLSAAVGTGWGVESTAEVCRGKTESLADYVTKLSFEAHETTGELAKLTQLPMAAPPRFRRLRSGKGFLPPRRKNPDVTGTLVRRSRDWDGTPVVLPIHAPPLESLGHVAGCCYHEEGLQAEELAWEATYQRYLGRWRPPARHSFERRREGPQLARASPAG